MLKALALIGSLGLALAQSNAPPKSGSSHYTIIDSIVIDGKENIAVVVRPRIVDSELLAVATEIHRLHPKSNIEFYDRMDAPRIRKFWKCMIAVLHGNNSGPWRPNSYPGCPDNFNKGIIEHRVGGVEQYSDQPKWFLGGKDFGVIQDLGVDDGPVKKKIPKPEPDEPSKQEHMDGATVFGILILCMIAFVIVGTTMSYLSWKANKKQFTDGVERVVTGIENFTPTQRVSNSGAAMAVDEQRALVCLIDNVLSWRLIKAAGLLSCEVLEDGVTVSQANRGSQLAGAAVGGLLLGGLGAVVGGLSGKSTQQTQVSKLCLRITVEDTQHPLFDFYFLIQPQQPIDKNSQAYRSARAQADHWHAMLTVLMRRASEGVKTDHILASGKAGGQLERQGPNVERPLRI